MLLLDAVVVMKPSPGRVNVLTLLCDIRQRKPDGSDEQIDFPISSNVVVAQYDDNLTSATYDIIYISCHRDITRSRLVGMNKMESNIQHDHAQTEVRKLESIYIYVYLVVRSPERFPWIIQLEATLEYPYFCTGRAITYSSS